MELYGPSVSRFFYADVDHAATSLRLRQESLLLLILA